MKKHKSRNYVSPTGHLSFFFSNASLFLGSKHFSPDGVSRMFSKRIPARVNPIFGRLHTVHVYSHRRISISVE